MARLLRADQGVARAVHVKQVAPAGTACQSRAFLPSGTKLMRRMILASLLAATPSIVTAPNALAAPTPKKQLMTPPAGARHYTISSIAGKHGDIWSWTMPDGRVAYRMSMSLRGWVTETDELL